MKQKTVYVLVDKKTNKPISEFFPNRPDEAVKFALSIARNDTAMLERTCKVQRWNVKTGHSLRVSDVIGGLS